MMGSKVNSWHRHGKDRRSLAARFDGSSVQPVRHPVSEAFGLKALQPVNLSTTAVHTPSVVTALTIGGCAG